jgi:hypothetical protein
MLERCGGMQLDQFPFLESNQDSSHANTSLTISLCVLTLLNCEKNHSYCNILPSLGQCMFCREPPYQTSLLT